jgi:chromosome segregation ATPase
MDEVPSDEEQRVAGLDDLEARVERLERAVVDLRNDAAAARVLAGAADRDVSEFRHELKAHTRSLNALRETQVEHGQRLDELDRKVSDGFSTVNVGMAQIVALLRNAEDGQA